MPAVAVTQPHYFFLSTFTTFHLHFVITVSFPMGNGSDEWGVFGSLASWHCGDLCSPRGAREHM